MIQLKSPKKRSASSKRWLLRQLNDPYVAQAQRLGYRSRAAFKLKQLDEKFSFLKPGQKVLDLGAAPGGWSQVVAEINNPTSQRQIIKGQIIAVDLQEMDPILGIEILQGDFNDLQVQQQIKTACGGKVDLILSDMAPAATGHSKTDHLKIIGLVEETYALAEEILMPGGHLVAKVWQGGAQAALLGQLKRRFSKICHGKPLASRKESPESYLIALGFHG